MNPDRDTEVLIVGAGPTGLMLANQLARRAVPFRLIDRHAGPTIESRAIGVQARTLEVFHKLGVADEAIARGRKGVGASIWARGRRAARVPLGDIGATMSPYPYVLMLGQDENERILNDHLRALGARVEWNTELVALAQHPDHAETTLRRADGSTEVCTARWVAGCDGARSAVRELNKIDFDGAPYEQVFYVADVVAQGPMTPGEVNVFLWPGGFHLFFPMRGENHWRVAGILPVDQRHKPDLKFEALEPSVRADVGDAFRASSCNWLSTYRVHHRKAKTFRAGRAFLLGDAAHIHSPVGAQGMNTGFMDAHNLAWKLALVSQGLADERLLETYALEREPFAERLLKTTDRAFKLIVAQGPLYDLVRTRVWPLALACAMRFRFMQRLAFRTISQVGMSYPHSPLSAHAPGAPRSGPRPGERFPWLKLAFAPGAKPQDLFDRLDDTKFNLLAFGQPAPKAFAPFDDLVRVHEIPVQDANRAPLDGAKIPSPSFYLLRPDGHVGLSGGPLSAEAVTGYLRERAGLRS